MKWQPGDTAPKDRMFFAEVQIGQAPDPHPPLWRCVWMDEENRFGAWYELDWVIVEIIRWLEIPEDDELKDCPFCGKQPEIIELPDPYKSSGWTIRCCHIEDFGFETTSKAELIQKWNTRAVD